jgi:DNA-binding IclR family transcriptional regulator
MTAGDVVTATGFKRPNVYPLLERLTELGYLEQVPDEQPVRWRRTRALAP